MPTSRLHWFISAAVCALGLTGPLEQAAAQAARPSAPDTTLPRGALAASPAYLRAIGASPTPFYYSDGRFVVLIAAAPTAATLDTMRGRALSAACSRKDLVGDASGSSALGGEFMVIAVSGARAGAGKCQIEWNVSPLSVWRAEWLPGPGGSAVREPLAARLQVDGAFVEPLMAFARPSSQLIDAGWQRAGSQLRYYYDMSVLRPRSDGRPHELVLQIWDRDPAPVMVDLGPAAADRLEQEFVGWKLATLPARESATGLDVRPARPLAPVMARIFDSSRTDLIAAGIRAAVYASRPDYPASSGMVARLLSAEALIAQREPALAQAVIAGVQREHPCLVPPAGSSLRLVETVTSLRNEVRCRPVPPLHAAGLSIIPGLGNYQVGDRSTAFIGASFVVGAFARAFYFHQQASKKYEEYQASGDKLESEVLFQNVRDLRGRRDFAIGVGTGLWILDGWSAYRAARMRARKIADDRL